MIDINKAKSDLNDGYFHRYMDGRISYTIFKSKDTPEIYYWYLIQDIPIKAKDKVVTLYESSVFYDLDEILEEFKMGGIT